MRILLTNDDGIEAPGLGVLEKIATDLTGDLTHRCFTLLILHLAAGALSLLQRGATILTLPKSQTL